ncbi:hypothetical protein GCM10010510_17430 [Streptomyces anandii JCM 4720]|nr:hypothetical protein GCM10010510_17430 [Streptomyces anandii JCM 4720]
MPHESGPDEVLVVERHTELLKDDFGQLAGSSAATVAEFAKDPSDTWQFRPNSEASTVVR